MAQVVVLDVLSGLPLLAEAIMSSDGTEFARFMKMLNASEWVRCGHDAYVHGADGKCPFCQQKLPDDFETSMASAFDESYQESLNTLRTLQSNYDTKMKALVALYQGNLDNALSQGRGTGRLRNKIGRASIPHSRKQLADCR
ncbi:AAA family ATPase [Bifidobacterium boum]|uniref:AAA family ATPase n=1 Tax=Bifidobacterium boum TaxID=78343 RepID=UPI003F9237F9